MRACNLDSRSIRLYLKTFVALLVLGASPATLADGHEGRISQFGIGYDGSTVTFQLSGWSRSNCTCYSAWPNQMCLNRNRPTYKEEYAWLLRSRTTDQYIRINIDETSCMVVAMFEMD